MYDASDERPITRDCPECGHVFQETLASFTFEPGRTCPSCGCMVRFDIREMRRELQDDVYDDGVGDSAFFL